MSVHLFLRCLVFGILGWQGSELHTNGQLDNTEFELWDSNVYEGHKLPSVLFRQEMRWKQIGNTKVIKAAYTGPGMYVLCWNLGMGKVTSDPTLFVLVGLVFFGQSSTLFQLMKGSVDITWHLPKEIARAFHLDAGVGACNILATSWRTCITVETRMGQVTQSYTDSCPVCIVVYCIKVQRNLGLIESSFHPDLQLGGVTISYLVC